MNYLVMECTNAYAVVLSNDGRFLKVANMRYQVGQTVTDVVELELPQTVPQAEEKRTRRWIASLTAMAACLALVVSTLFVGGQTPCASVYMTINPEVRIDVNRNDRVVSVEGVNADGQALLDGYDHRRKDLDTVMDELVDRAIDMDYLHEGGTITLSLDGDEEWIVTHESHLNEELTSHLTDRITVTIDVEHRQNAPSEPTVPAGTIQIPLDPDEYGESDYGDSTEPATTAPAPSDDGGSDYDDIHNDDEDHDGDDGHTDYGHNGDDPGDESDGSSPYEDNSGDSDDDGSSPYEDNSGDSDDDGSSSYEDHDDDADDEEDDD